MKGNEPHGPLSELVAALLQMRGKCSNYKLYVTHGSWALLFSIPCPPVQGGVENYGRGFLHSLFSFIGSNLRFTGKAEYNTKTFFLNNL